MGVQIGELGHGWPGGRTCVDSSRVRIAEERAYDDMRSLRVTCGTQRSVMRYRAISAELSDECATMGAAVSPQVRFDSTMTTEDTRDACNRSR